MRNLKNFMGGFMVCIESGTLLIKKITEVNELSSLFVLIRETDEILHFRVLVKKALKLLIFKNARLKCDTVVLFCRHLQMSLQNIYALATVDVPNLATFRIDVSPLLDYEGERKVTDEIIQSNQQRMYISFGVNTISTIFILFIILKFSPKNMGIYKYMLINISVCYRILFLHNIIF